MTARLLMLLVLCASASALSCIGSSSNEDSRYEGPGCQPACVADDYNLPGHAVCVTEDYVGCSNGAPPVCPSNKAPTCPDGPPECEDGSKPSGCF